MTTRSQPTARSGPEQDRPGQELDAVMSERRRLTALAYRLLGSLSEAEDAVQETYARWYAMSRQLQDAIEVPGAWLTTVAGRVCLNLLRSARVRRETYVGDWIPEPLPERTEWTGGRPDGATADPARARVLDAAVAGRALRQGPDAGRRRDRPSPRRTATRPPGRAASPAS